MLNSKLPWFSSKLKDSKNVKFKVNDPTRYEQLLRERRKTAMTHTQVLWEKGSGRSTLSGEMFGQTSSQQLNITVLVVLGVIIPK